MIIRNYEACFHIPEGQMRIVLSFNDIDTKNFKVSQYLITKLIFLMLFYSNSNAV